MLNLTSNVYCTNKKFLISYFCTSALFKLIISNFFPSFFSSFLPSSIYLFLPSFLPSFISTFLPSFLPSFIPSFLYFYLPSFFLMIRSYFSACIFPSSACIRNSYPLSKCTLVPLFLKSRPLPFTFPPSGLCLSEVSSAGCD